MMKQLMRSGGVLSEATQSFLLQVESSGDGCVSGMLHWVNHEKALYFTGIDQAILLINAWLEEENPKPEGLTLRTFRAGRKVRPAICDSNPHLYSGNVRRGDARRKEAFLIHIISSEHSSWQGEVRWNAQRICFRSTLELMCLLHSALDPAEAAAESADESDEMLSLSPQAV